MRFGLIAKLFCAVLIVNLAVVLAMSFAARVSFDRGFVRYLEEQEMQRAAKVVPALAAAYQEHHNWDFVQKDWVTWLRLIHMATDARHADPSGTSTPDPTGANMRFALLDGDGRYLAGNTDKNDDAIREPINVGGKTVGWLNMVCYREVVKAGDLQFQNKQDRASWIIAGVTFLLAAIIALWLVRTLSAPLKRLIDATHRLAGGDYSVRVPAVPGGDIGQLEADFNVLSDTLARNERMRRDFVADVSHELRTPLAIMHGELEALEDGVRPVNGHAVLSLRAEVRRLSSLVDDLHTLSLGDLENLSYRHDQLDLAAVVRHAVALYKGRLSDAGIALEASGMTRPLWIRADKDRLQQVLCNLLENAVRYVDAQQALRLHLHAEHDDAVLDVQDSGPGVPDDALPKLFDRFYRVEASRNRATGGSGLGLPICRSIIDAHGGSIVASKAPQGGLWVRIRLPLASVAA